MSYLFLTDVICALQFSQVPCISTKELFMRMPGSLHNFHDLYKCLISGSRAVPPDVRAHEDGLLLLTGLCADILYTYRAFTDIIPSVGAISDQYDNPFRPFTPTSEESEFRFALKEGLSRWFSHFGKSASREILSLFYFCTLISTQPEILLLPHAAGYDPTQRQLGPRVSSDDKIRMANPDEVMKLSWLILENSATRPNSNTNNSVWTPAVLFHSALSIWWCLRDPGISPQPKTGTLRALRLFRDELNALPWPCCTEMSRTLDHLI